MEKKCNDNLYVKPIEFCSIYATSNLNLRDIDSTFINTDKSIIFSDTIKTNYNDLNTNFRDDTNNNFIYEDKKDKKNLCEKTNKIDEYYFNCVLQTSNPLFTYKDGYCMVYPEFDFGKSELKKIEEKDDFFIKLNRNKLKDEEGNFKYQQIQNNKYCEDRWFDWIVIPNYHFGNRILKDSGVYSKEDVKICYKNCDYNELPYINSSGSNLCIPKEYAYEGKFEKKLDYSPIALINLIGNNKEHLNKLYKHLFYYKLNKKVKTDKYELNKTIIDPFFLNINNNNDNYIIKEVIEEIKAVLNKIVNDDNLNIPDYSMEYKHLTYKHPYFKENDLLSIFGMDKNEILSNDIILIHTAYLAYNYKDFITKILDYNSFENDNEKTYFRFKFNDNKFNINKNLEELDITKYDDTFNTELNKSNYDKFKSNYDANNPMGNFKNLVDILKKRRNFNLTKQKRHRLANILYKAINICYDNKTDFSKNLIKRTNDAINKYNSSDYQEISKEIYDLNNLYILNGFEINYIKNDNKSISEILKKNFDDNTKGAEVPSNMSREEWFNSFQRNFEENFLLYSEEQSELIAGNKCKSGQFIENGKCVDCSTNCDTKDKCINNIN